MLSKNRFFQFRIWHLLVLMVWLSILMAGCVGQSARIIGAVVAACAASIMATVGIFSYTSHFLNLLDRFSRMPRLLALPLALFHWTSLFFYGLVGIAMLTLIGLLKVIRSSGSDWPAFALLLGIPITVIFIVGHFKTSQN